MGMDFPNSPTEGQNYTAPSGAKYVWNSPVWKFSGGAVVDYVRKTGDTMTGALLASPTGSVDLGSSALRWRTIYTSDLSLSNGIGDWTIVEGENDLFITNNRTGKRYRFVLEEV